MPSPIISRHLAVLLLAALLVGGCGPKVANMPSFSYVLKEKPEGIEAIMQETPLTSADLSDRGKDIAALRTWYHEVSKNAAEVQDDMRKEADLFSATHLTVGGVGVAAGIAAAALVVASPANAVWVSALSGTAAGAAGYQTSLATQGLSREAVAEAYKAYSETFTNSTGTYADDMAKLNACLKCPDDQWFARRGTVEADIIRLQALALSPPMRQGEKELQEKQAEFYKAMLKAQEEMYTSVLTSIQTKLTNTR